MRLTSYVFSALVDYSRNIVEKVTEVISQDKSDQPFHFRLPKKRVNNNKKSKIDTEA
jgi:hypothetical protein